MNILPEEFEILALAKVRYVVFEKAHILVRIVTRLRM